VVSASDSDVIKAYVAQGLGIAIVPTLALDESDNVDAADVTSLFPRSTMTVSLRPDFYLRGYLTDFIRMLAPKLSREAIQKIMSAGGKR
jgi:LysR family cys regulon transcriptional activator